MEAPVDFGQQSRKFIRPRRQRPSTIASTVTHQGMISQHVGGNDDRSSQTHAIDTGISRFSAALTRWSSRCNKSSKRSSRLWAPSQSRGDEALALDRRRSLLSLPAVWLDVWALPLARCHIVTFRPSRIQLATARHGSDHPAYALSPQKCYMRSFAGSLRLLLRLQFLP